jgi:hypothetical protein
VFKTETENHRSLENFDDRVYNKDKSFAMYRTFCEFLNVCPLCRVVPFRFALLLIPAVAVLVEKWPESVGSWT